MTEIRKPHPYADVIKDWADGAEVEYSDQYAKKWVADENPSFNRFYKWRVKPETIRYRLFIQNYNGLKSVETTASESRKVENWPTFVEWIGDWQEVVV